MPTGYTAGILDGKIKDFHSFAKLCARAFGATIHMRDDALDTEYTPRTPSTYHTDELTRLRNEVAEVEIMSDAKLKKKIIAELSGDKKYQSDRIEEERKHLIVLSDFLEQAKSYQPPTKEHVGIKEFMIQQIEDTIKHDADSTYHKEKLADIEIKLATLDIKKARLERIAAINKDISYHEQLLGEEIERCEKANKWVAEYYKSIAAFTE